jgi:hypothetical protein
MKKTLISLMVIVGLVTALGIAGCSARSTNNGITERTALMQTVYNSHSKKDDHAKVRPLMWVVRDN